MTNQQLEERAVHVLQGDLEPTESLCRSMSLLTA